VRDSPPPQRGVHLVDGFGLVGCPRSGTDLPVATCLGCRELQTAVTDDGGRVREVHCVDAPLDLRPCWPWLLGWNARRRG
jgi:hypothetical protein